MMEWDCVWRYEGCGRKEAIDLSWQELFLGRRCNELSFRVIVERYSQFI